MKLSFTHNMTALRACGMFSLVQQVRLSSESFRGFPYISVQLLRASHDVVGPVFRIQRVDGWNIINHAEYWSPDSVGGWFQAELSPSQLLPKDF
jgi:hypothetical protein